MYMSAYYIQNIVPKICIGVYVNVCSRDDKFNVHTTCSKVNDYLKY
jgi:hypothetical protein